MAGKAWTPAEIASLRDLYPRSKRSIVLAALPGRTLSSMLNQVRAMELKKPGYKFWTGADDILLAKIFPHESQAAICDQLAPHSWASISRRACDLKISRDRAKTRAEFEVLRELRRIRRQRNLPVDTLASRFGSYGSIVSAWEIGMKVPNLRGFLAWVEALGLEIVFQRKGLSIRQATPLIEMPGKHQLMARSASVSARRPT